jgi:Flp pilus assembly protein CpaB
MRIAYAHLSTHATHSRLRLLNRAIAQQSSTCMRQQSPPAVSYRSINAQDATCEEGRQIHLQSVEQAQPALVSRQISPSVRTLMNKVVAGLRAIHRSSYRRDIRC